MGRRNAQQAMSGRARLALHSQGGHCTKSSCTRVLYTRTHLRERDEGALCANGSYMPQRIAGYAQVVLLCKLQCRLWFPAERLACALVW